MSDEGQTAGTDDDRLAALREAEAKAFAIFDAVESRGLIRAGRSEREMSDEIRDIAKGELGTRRFWHKRILRGGPNTVHPYSVNPPEHVLAEDDICFVDLGPVFAEWEADIGRTYVVGDDPEMHAIAEAAERIWVESHSAFLDAPEMTGAELFADVRARIAEAGYEHAEKHVGHLIGSFPHARIPDDAKANYLAPGNDRPLRGAGPDGRRLFWILEVHLRHRSGAYGAFVERLLDDRGR